MAKNLLSSSLLVLALLSPPVAHAENLLIPGDPATQVEAASEAPSQAVAPSRRLVPLEEPSADFEFSGEMDVREFSFRLDGRGVEAGGDLVLAYQNAVSVLPDDAVLNVEINGKPAGGFPIASPFGFTRQKIPLAPALLRTGTNRARLSVVQHHRVDCSLDATYELWTRLSPSLSGFETAGAQGFFTFNDLYGVGRMEDGATELRLVLPASADAEMLNAASSIVQVLSLYLGRRDVVVTVADRPGEGPGIDLFAGVMGIDPENAAGMRLYAEAPYGVSVRSSSDPSRAAVIFRAADAEQLRQYLLEAVRGPLAEGLKASRSGRRYGVVDAAAGARFTLKDAGYRSTSFAGRLMRTHFDVVMPADFYAAEYGTFDLELSAATSPGLDPSAQLLVRVNDRVVNSFPFRNTDGQSFDGKLIELPLRAFHPGVNKVEMLAELPHPADKTCTPQTRNDSKPRYVLLEDTTFTVPPLARVSRLPDLAALAGNAYPYNGGKPFDILLPGAESHSASAAMTVLARLAMTSGAPVNGTFRTDLSPVGVAGDALVISADQSGQAALSPSRLDGRFALDDSAARLLTADRTATAGIFAEPQEEPQDATSQLMQSFENANAGAESELSWKARFRSVVAMMSGKFGSWLKYQDAEPIAAPTDALLTIRQMERPDGAGVVTEIHAGSPEDLSKGMRTLADTASWAALKGSAAAIDARNLSLVHVPGQAPLFVEVTEHSIGNYRRIAAAWLSDNFQTYVVMVIALIGIFAGWLGVVVQRKGVRTTK